MTPTADGAVEAPSWLTAQRRAARQQFEELGLPTDAEEIWRYSRIEDLELERYPAVDPSPAADRVGLADDLAELLRVLSEASVVPPTVVVVRDGWPSLPSDAPAGITIERPGEDRWPLGAIAPASDAFVALNTAQASAPLRIHVGADAPPGATVVVIHWAGTDGAATFPRLLVSVDPQAEARVIEVVASDDIEALVVPVTELDLAPGARLSYVNVQLLGRRAWQIGLQASRVARDATLTSATVALGGSYARVRTDAKVVGQGATSRLFAVWFGAEDQMHDLRTVQAHEAPRTTSELVFKGVVANHSHSVYTGVIRVEKGAQGTRAMQTNRNLVLDEGAHADSVPNLEIEDNDVHCSHASAVGPIDDDQRFYLESRGVPTQVADRLIAQGFLDEVLERIPAPGLAGWLRAKVAQKLADAEAAR